MSGVALHEQRQLRIFCACLCGNGVCADRVEGGNLQVLVRVGRLVFWCLFGSQPSCHALNTWPAVRNHNQPSTTTIGSDSFARHVWLCLARAACFFCLTLKESSVPGCSAFLVVKQKGWRGQTYCTRLSGACTFQVALHIPC